MRCTGSFCESKNGTHRAIVLVGWGREVVSSMHEIGVSSGLTCDPGGPHIGKSNSCRELLYWSDPPLDVSLFSPQYLTLFRSRQSRALSR